MERVEDIFRNVGKYIKIFTSMNCSDVPTNPGVYAFYLPLKIKADIKSDIINWDKILMGNTDRTFGGEDINFPWETISVDLNRKSQIQINEDSKKLEEYSNNFSNELKFDLYALSIFAPPLYIGKTNNLNRRYNEHLKNTEQSKFKERFELHTKDMGIQIKDLIFACVILDKAIDNVEYSRTIEGLINKLFKPIYGVR